jgi:hypothetical protein
VVTTRITSSRTPPTAATPAPIASVAARPLPVQPVELDSTRSLEATATLHLSPPALARPTVEPLTATEARLHLTVSRAFLEKLEAARLALSHSMPGASAEDVLTAGLDLLLDRAARRKGLVAKPRPAPENAPAEPGADYIPAAVRREVWERDEGKCQWPVDGGGVCGSQLRPELDHVHLKCRGAKPIASELRVLCALHNQLAARLALGDQVMDRYTRDPRQPGLFGASRGQPGVAKSIRRAAHPSTGSG